MNKDRVEGKVKDIAGRTERQVGEWTGSAETEIKGAAKQAEGKAQNAWGKAKDAVQKSADDAKKQDERNEDIAVEEDEAAARRRAS